MDLFEKAWKEHLNQRGDRLTLSMIESFGIEGVISLCKLAYHIGMHDSYDEIKQEMRDAIRHN